MSIEVKLLHPTTISKDLNLGASEIRLEIRRTPMGSPLPGGQMIITELGMLTKTLAVSGMCEIEETSDIVKWDELEEAADTWWESGLLGLQEREGVVYSGQISNLDIRQEESNPTVGSFTLSFLVKKKGFSRS